MIGRSIRQIGFRSKLSASVVAVIRNNLRVPGKLGDVILEAGDLLLLDAPETFDRYSELVRVWKNALPDSSVFPTQFGWSDDSSPALEVAFMAP